MAKKFLKVGFIFLSVLLVPISVFAETRYSQEEISLPEEESFKNLYVFSAKNINLTSTVNGDLWASSRDLLVDGPIMGSLTSIALDKIVINKPIGNSLRGYGKNVSIYETITGDIIIAGETLFLDKTSKLGGDLYFWGKTLNIDGKVDGRVIARAKEVEISGQLAKDVRLYETSKILITPQAKITGKLTYFAEKPLINENLDNVSKIEYVAQRNGEALTKLLAVFKINLKGIRGIFYAVTFIAQFLLALFFYLVLPKFSAEVIKKSLQNPFNYLLKGILVIIFAPLAIFFLMTTILGYSLAIFGLLLYLLLLATTSAFTPMILGGIFRRWVLKDKRFGFFTVAIGMILLIALLLIPYLGPLLHLFLISLTFASILSSLKESLANYPPKD
jgi:cytoskeletal protein CcmA (bactofilin family)